MKIQMTGNNTATLSILLLATAMHLSACAPMVTTHGNMVKETTVAEITPMTSTRADVLDKWGPPTTVSSFDPNIWYYIGETQSRKAILDSDVDKRQVIKVVFADDDTVVEASMVDTTAAAEIEPVDRKTPTAGKEFTAFQQFIGNLGKFNTDKRTAGK